MSLSKERREELAKIHVARYYPEASEEEVRTIISMTVAGFKGGYSPNPNEWDKEGGIGTGQTFEEFAIDRGNLLTRLARTSS